MWLAHLKGAGLAENLNNDGNWNSSSSLYKLVPKVILRFSGIVILASGLYETFTGNKISPLLQEFDDNSKDLLNSLVKALDDLPTVLKLGGGYSLYRLPSLLKRKTP